MAEIIFIGGGLLFIGAALASEWNSARCSSQEAWFHDWVRDMTVPPVERDYKDNNATYILTTATIECRYCKERKQVEISDTKPVDNTDYAD